MTRVAVIGAGSWGTALALLLCRNGHAVTLWGHDPEHIAQLCRDRENRVFLPGFELPATLEPNADLVATVAAADAVLVVVPSQFFANVVARLAPALPPGVGLAWATKGALTWYGAKTRARASASSS